MSLCLCLTIDELPELSVNLIAAWEGRVRANELILKESARKNGSDLVHRATEEVASGQWQPIL